VRQLVWPMLLLLGVLAGCESTGRVVSSTTSDEASPATIVSPVIEKEERVEPVTEGPETGAALAEPIEPEKETRSTTPEPETQESLSPEKEKSTADIATEPEAKSLIPTSPAPSSGQSQQTTPSQTIQPKKLQDIYFDFDQATIRHHAEPVLEANARLLDSRYANRSVLIEGHCDERGSVEYNLVLGVRRAQVVKAYLEDLGVSKSRIRIVSYGKERPVCLQHNEDCWQKNRRVHFVLQ